MNKKSRHFHTSEEEMNKKSVRMEPIVNNNPVLGRNQDLQKGNYINKCQRPTAAFVCSYLCFFLIFLNTIENQIHKNYNKLVCFLACNEQICE